MTRLNRCHNRRPFVPTVEVQDGWIRTSMRLDVVSRVGRVVEVPCRMTPDCQYTHTDLGQADKGCAGCKHRVEGASE